MKKPNRETLFDHFAGSALGCFIGDALGMPVEGWSPERIRTAYGLLDDLHPGRFPAGSYTDDTEMTIGLLEALVETGRFDPALTAQKFLENFHPDRGYGGRIYDLMNRLAAGVPWDRVGTDSFGNGAAMRAAPIGFYFYDDLETVADLAAAQAVITHRHPEALAGAVTQAGLVAMALKAGIEGRILDPAKTMDALAALARPFHKQSADRLLNLKKINPGPLPEMIPQIRGLYECNVKAIEAVGPAVAALLYTNDFPSAVILAVNLGGDTDTIGAMAGAAAGAYYGLKAIPEKWLSRLENGPKGREYLLELCRKAAAQAAGRPT